MNFYQIDYEEQGHSGTESQQPIDFVEQSLNQHSCEHQYEYESEIAPEVEKLNTFDGYLPEEPIIYFNCVEEPPKKKVKSVQKRSKKIKKSDTETDLNSTRKSVMPTLSNDVAKLQQCQMLKTIISQMENILQQTRSQILAEYKKLQQQ